MTALRAGLVWCCGSALLAQVPWSVRCGEGEVRIVGPGSATGRGPHFDIESLPPGRYAVHFAPDAAGKPRSLQFEVPEGAAVHVAAAAAGPAVGEVFGADDVGWQPAGAGSPLHLRDCERNVRLELVFEAVADGTPALLARHGESGDHYRCELDLAAGELRLRRRLGGSDLVLAKSACKLGPGRHRLALQLEGFRLTAAVDEAPLLACFDGGLGGGRAGVQGAAAGWQLRLGAVASSRDSAAVVLTAGTAELHAATTAPSGHWQVMGMWLDRPHALVPTLDGLEPSVLQRPAAPLVALAEWRDGWAQPGIRELVTGGAVRATIRWPDVPALRYQAALLRALFVTPGGEAIEAIGPAVPLHR